MNLYVKNLSCINIFILDVHDGDFTKNNVNSVEDQVNKTQQKRKSDFDDNKSKSKCRYNIICNPFLYKIKLYS